MCAERGSQKAVQRSESMLCCVYYGRELKQTGTAGEIIAHIIYSLANADPVSCCSDCSVDKEVPGADRN